MFRVDTPVGRSAEDLVRHILELCDGRCDQCTCVGTDSAVCSCCSVKCIYVESRNTIGCNISLSLMWGSGVGGGS